MSKRILAMLLFAAVLGLSSLGLAVDAGHERVTLGADLTLEQRAAIYKDFGLEEVRVKELTVTNKEERAYLERLVPDKKIGSVALSCVYIKTLEKDAGLFITSNNINWCTNEMYKNALSTAGIVDAQVKISAPFPVSGTAALTGLYKAYEDVTGEKLSDLAKSAATEEIIVTGDLAQMLGSVDASALVNELKLILDQTAKMSDDELKKEIRSIAKELNIALTEGQIEQLVSLCRTLEKLDPQALKERVQSLTKTLQSMGKFERFISDAFTNIKKFFGAVGEFFLKLFK